MRLQTILRHRLHTADTGAPAGGAAPTPETAADDPGGEQKPVSLAELIKTHGLQKDLDGVIQERLDRAQRAAEKKQAEAAEQARLKALEEQGEWQKLAEQRAARIADLEAATKTAQTLEQERDRYKTAVTTLLKTQRTDLPKPILDLLDKLDPVDQLEWIAANRQELAKPSGGTPPRAAGRAGAPPTGAADANRRSTVNF